MSPFLRYLIAAIQGLGAILMLYLLGGLLPQIDLGANLLLYLLFALVALVALLGALLLALDRRLGWQLSMVVQALQIPHWTSALLGYRLELGAAVLAGFEYGPDRFALLFLFDLPIANFRLYLVADDLSTLTVAINLLALVFLALLLRGFPRRFPPAPAGASR